MAMELKQERELDVYRRRIELLVGARYTRVNDAISAAKVQDRIRHKIGTWKGAEEIRKWRMRG